MIYSIATLTQSFEFNLNDCLKFVYPYLESDTFGIRLRKIRRNNNVKAEELGKILNVSTGTIISYENCNINPSPNIIIKLHQLFGNIIICDDYMEFIVRDCSKILELWRNKNSLDKRRASKILGISENAYSNCINKRNFISKKTFDRIREKIRDVL